MMVRLAENRELFPTIDTRYKSLFEVNFADEHMGYIWKKSAISKKFQREGQYRSDHDMWNSISRRIYAAAIFEK
jgi:hypothetical protein